MFEIKNRFQYTLAPYNPGGGGNSGGTITGNSYLIQQPGNVYADLTVPLFQPYTVYIGDTGFQSIAYFENQSDNVNQVPAVLINQGGIPLAANLRSWTNVNASSGYPITITRRNLAPGLNRDEVLWYTGVGTIYSDINNTYVVLQQAVPVTYYGINNPPDGLLGPGSNTSVLVSDIVSLNKASNRGDDLQSLWVVLKTDPAGSFANIPAVPSVDYTLITGTLSSDNIQIQFINGTVNFTVQNMCAGYTFGNNPYMIFPGTSTNQSTSAYNFILSIPTATYEVLVPKIDISLSVPAASLLGSNPFETYQNQLITVTPTLDLTTGYWKKKVSMVPDVYLTKTMDEYIAEINQTCNVTLEVRDSVTNVLAVSVPGLSVTTVSIPIISTYTFNYITQVK